MFFYKFNSKLNRLKKNEYFKGELRLQKTRKVQTDQSSAEL